jgi:hypothetical protein
MKCKRCQTTMICEWEVRDFGCCTDCHNRLISILNPKELEAVEPGKTIKYIRNWEK